MTGPGLPAGWEVPECLALTYRKRPLGLPFQFYIVLLYGCLSLALLTFKPLFAAFAFFSITGSAALAAAEDEAFGLELWWSQLFVPERADP